MLFATALTSESMADAIDQRREVMVALAREVLGVAEAAGIQPLGFDGFEPEVIASQNDTAVQRSLDGLIAVRRRDQKTHSGVWRDLAVRKRRTEVDHHFLPVVAEAERHGLRVPRVRRLIEMIHDIEEGRRDFSLENLDALDQSARTASLY
jgi:2-dehydropantoate 2-reductase